MYTSESWLIVPFSYSGPCLNAWNDVHSLFGDQITQQPGSQPLPVECLLVIDSGFSQTTITPVYRGRPLQRAIRRLEIGGKHLTNYIKELVSIRQYNMVDETYIMNDVKESVCYVSNDFKADMEKTWKGNRKRGAADPGEGIVVDYVLPDPNTRRKGFMRPHDPQSKKKKGLLSGPGSELSEDVMTLGNERFTVPEILFHPQDIGMKQAGIPEIVMQSLSVLPTGLHPSFLANVLLVGGNASLPGFLERMYVFPPIPYSPRNDRYWYLLSRNDVADSLNRETDLRQLASAECVVRVRKPEE